eukprot:TRINITY_DN11420_c0_g1_i2.p1 TRINITY_DN11420_c0_g1~~TRINITY_DN11420_c0_g1_i2.p1  ORF type:complete len:616 (-),score=159.82 TRINITY_DN11420_c0_g1_i2:83-1930(-)
MGTKGWAKGAWAADAELEEEEEKEKKEKEPYRPGAYSVAAKQEEVAFPSLGEAQKKGKKKGKGQTLSLSEFTTGQTVGLGARRTATGSDTGKLTVDEMMNLPRGPRERDESEVGALGGGFKGYGGQRGGDRENRNERGGDREDGFRDRDRDEGPSRADESNNWGDKKQFVPSSDRSRGGGGFDRDRNDRDRRGGGASDDLGPSRADEVDNWGANKKFVASSAPRGGGGFGGGGGSMPPGRGGMDSDRWARAPLPDRGTDAAPARSGERPRLVLQKRTLDTPEGGASTVAPPAVTNGSSEGASAGEEGSEVAAPVKPKPNPFGAAKPRDEPVVPAITDAAATSSSAAIGSEGGAGKVQAGGATSAPRPKLNPFGDAKPREVRLQEQGKDWRKIDMELEHKGVDRPETEEEQRLKEKIAEIEERLERVLKPAGGEEGAKEGEPPSVSTDADSPAVTVSSTSADTSASKSASSPSAVSNGDSVDDSATSAANHATPTSGAAAPRQLTYAEKMAQAIIKEEDAKGLSDERRAQLAAEKEALQNDLFKLTRELDDNVRFVRGGAGGSGAGGPPSAFRGRDGRAEGGAGDGARGGGDRFGGERGGGRGGYEERGRGGGSRW